MRKSMKDKLMTCVFIVPTLFIFINVVIIPFIIGVIYSITDWNGFGLKDSSVVGLSNYITALTDEKFLNAFGLTFKYAIFMIIFVNIIGLSMALLVTSKIKTKNFLRSIFFMPNLIGGLILGFIWQFIFTKFFVQIGELLNQTNVFFNWLDDPKMSFWALIIVGVWQMAGYVMIIYIASIQSISDEVLEAAEMDGCNKMQKLRFITLPLIMPAFTISLFLTLSNGFKQYDTNLSLTGGGPYGTTELITMNIFNTAFSYNQYGVAQAKAIIFFIIILVITIIQVSITKKREVEM